MSSASDATTPKGVHENTFALDGELKADEAKFRTDMATDILMPGALRLVAHLGLSADTAGGFSLLDSACGTGLVADAVYRTVPRRALEGSRILCGDISEGVVKVTRQRAGEEGWGAVQAMVADATDTSGKVGDGEMDFATCSFGLHVIPDPDGVLRGECLRAATGCVRLALLFEWKSAGPSRMGSVDAYIYLHT